VNVAHAGTPAGTPAVASHSALRERLRRFDFLPRSDCDGCQLAESNEEDRFGNPFPVCGDCLWARGVARCA
jgi:hypothetical protein